MQKLMEEEIKLKEVTEEARMNFLKQQQDALANKVEVKVDVEATHGDKGNYQNNNNLNQSFS